MDIPHRDKSSFALCDEVSGAPVCQPLKTLEEVHGWSAGYNPAARPHVDLGTDRWDTEWKKRPRTLVCHDMAGGYLQDRFLQGSEEGDAYCFYHWQYVDIFVYFSHYFVTLPPPCWTNMAHRHGTLMLGTVITEWDEGKARCEEFLKDQASCEALADKLVALAEFYRFDGWLINIENVIEESKVPNLVGFVQYLTRRMHESQPHSVVLWYDSVIKTGQLEWQNELNDLNRCFFDVCDGLFVNYTWKEENLKQSTELAKQCDRQYDVYIGIDVFGRGCLGGGGFNTKEAVSAARDMSIALFAQGWVYERQDKATFVERENRFWSLLEPYCRHHRYHGLPFASHFCKGQGDRFYRNGQMLSDKPWTNLSVQSLQPTFTEIQFNDNSDGPQTLMQSWKQDAYHGGSCLKVSASQSSVVRLFSTKVDMAEPLLVSYTYKKLSSAGSCALHLKISSPTSASTLVLGDACRRLEEQPSESSVVNVPVLSCEEARQTCGTYIAAGISDWNTRYYKLEGLKQENLEEIGFKISPGNEENKDGRVEYLLGQLQILELQDVKTIPLVTNLTACTSGTDAVCLQWTFPETADHFLIHSREDGGDDDLYSLLGSTHATCYQTAAPSKYCTMLYRVQPVLTTGFAIPLISCPTVAHTRCA